MTPMLSHVKKYIAYKYKTVPPLYIFCVSEKQHVSSCVIQTESRLKNSVWAHDMQTTALAG